MSVAIIDNTVHPYNVSSLPTRSYSTAMETQLGQPIVIDYRPGAGTPALARAKQGALSLGTSGALTSRKSSACNRTRSWP